MELTNLTIPVSLPKALPQDDGTWKVVVVHHHPPHQIAEPGVNVHHSTTLPEVFSTEEEALVHGRLFDSQLAARTHVMKVTGKKGFHG